MCWNIYVSMLFSMFDIAASLLLIKRNRNNDRLYALSLSPVALQETFQIVLWATIGTNSDPTKCYRINIFTSFITRTTVLCLPFLGTFLATYTYSKIKGWDLPRIGFMLAATVYTVIVQCLQWYSMIRRPVGTILGPNGHQVWPNPWEYYYPYSNLLYGLAILGYVVFTMVPVYLYLQPRTSAFAILIILGGLFLVSIIIYPAEWEPIWCWSAFLLFIALLLEPYFVHLDSTYQKHLKGE
jgi:hypothetical protein